MSSERIWNSKCVCMCVIIREPQQPLLNYRSHQHDWMKLGHCNGNLIIYRLYYYSNNCMEKVIILPSPPTQMKGAELCFIPCLESFTNTSRGNSASSSAYLLNVYYFGNFKKIWSVAVCSLIFSRLSDTFHVFGAAISWLHCTVYHGNLIVILPCAFAYYRY